VYNFKGAPDGERPTSGLALSSNRVFYGTTTSGGASGYGTVFSLALISGTWTERVLYSFTGGTDGGNPRGRLIVGPNGALFGTTEGGGTAGYGTAYMLAFSGGAWSQKVIYNFLGGTDGANPTAGLALASDQLLYGTTYVGGTAGRGTIFKLLPPSPPSTAWREELLYNFTGGADGANPWSGVVIGKSNVLYGSTLWGGDDTRCPWETSGCGTVFELIPPSPPPGIWTLKTLYTFEGTDGSQPLALTVGSGGGLYGVASGGGSDATGCYPASKRGCGTVFLLEPPAVQGGTWTKNNLHVFMGAPDGGVPNGVVFGPNGVLYGTTRVGGTAGNLGTVFQLTP